MSYRGRDCSDVILPFKSLIGPPLLKLKGKLWFVCLASSSSERITEHEKFSGNVFIFESHDIWTNVAKEKIRSAQNLLRAYSYGREGSLEDYFSSTFQELNEALPRLSAFRATFSITRKGMLEIEVDDQAATHPDAPKLPDENTRRSHIIHVLAAQLFFFLRDIGHRHQHHDPNTDTVVDLYRLDPQDRFGWKLLTLYALYRKVISYKRVRQEASFASSRGVLAYARTFRSLVESDADEASKARLPQFHADNVFDSINAVDDSIIRKRDVRADAQGITRELILAALALAIAIIGVFQITDVKITVEPSKFLRFLAEMIITQPITTLGLLGGLIFTFRMITGVHNPAEFKITRALVRLLQPYDIRLAILFFMVLFGAIVFVIYKLLWL